MMNMEKSGNFDMEPMILIISDEQR